MIPIGVGIVWASYTVGIWGYCLVRGYNVTFRQLFKTTWPAGQAKQTLQQTVAQAEANFRGAANAAQQVGLRASGRAPKAGA